MNENFFKGGDKRYAIRLEYTGKEKPQYVVRFLRGFVGSRATLKGALTLAASHNEKRFLTNPSKRGAPRIGTARPRRKSQITGKAPSSRLVKRRTSNSRKGYFPNPSEKSVREVVLSYYPYCIFEVSVKGSVEVGRYSRKDIASTIAEILNERAQPNVKYTVLTNRFAPRKPSK